MWNIFLDGNLLSLSIISLLYGAAICLTASFRPADYLSCHHKTMNNALLWIVCTYKIFKTFAAFFVRQQIAMGVIPIGSLVGM